MNEKLRWIMKDEFRMANFRWIKKMISKNLYGLMDSISYDLRIRITIISQKFIFSELHFKL